MTSASKDDADHLAAYAEHLIERAKYALLNSIAQKQEARQLLMRAKVAIREAQTQIK